VDARLPPGKRRSVPLIKRTLLVFSTLCLCLALDQTTKWLATLYLAPRPVSFSTGTFRLEYIENPGSFLSLGAGLPSDVRFALFTAFIGILLLGLLVFILRWSRQSVGVLFAISMLVGGGIGNLIDRILRHGYVIDFMNIRAWYFSTGIFNFADVEITAGIGMLLIMIILKGVKTGAPPKAF
jgi:signal peptidase II